MTDNVESRIPQFTVRLALIVVPEIVGFKALESLREGLTMRQHLMNPRVTWDPDTNRVTVQIDAETADPQEAAQYSEDLFETAAVVLEEFEKMRVEILDTRPLI